MSVESDDENPIENKPSVKNFRKAERISEWFINYVAKYIQIKDIKIDPFDTLILKTHYNFTSHLFLTIFVFVTSHFLAEEPATCVDKFDRSPPPEELLEICLTYPYAEFPYNNDRNQMVRRYALHYKWVHIACLILSFFYKGVLIGQTILKYKHHRKMLEEMCETKLVDRFTIAEHYFGHHKGCHKRMYARFICLHLIALFINVVSFLALNLTFQNQYWNLPKYLFVKRDPSTFHDTFSLVFPPFAHCEITTVHHILVHRTKLYGCYLPLMEIYEKIFMILWFWQVILASWTILFILYYFPLPFCYMWRLNLLGNFSFRQFDPFTSFAKRFSTDEIFALRAIGGLIPGEEFGRLLSSLLQNQLEDPNGTLYYDPLNKNYDLNAHSSFQSCIQDHGSVEGTHPIGFEKFPSPIKMSPDFKSGTSSSIFIANDARDSTPNPYQTWKRSLSLEFDHSPLKRSMAFDSTLHPLMQYLRRDEFFFNSSTLIRCPVQEEGWTQNAPSHPVDQETFNSGGEKGVHFSSEADWDEEDDSPAPNSSIGFKNYRNHPENETDYAPTGPLSTSTSQEFASFALNQEPNSEEVRVLIVNTHPDHETNTYRILRLDDHQKGVPDDENWGEEN